MSTIAMMLVIGFLAYVFKHDWGLIGEIRMRGVEAEAVVSRIEETKRAADGADYYRRYFYAYFDGQDGRPIEARLLNPGKSLLVGDRLVVKYLDDKNDCAVIVQRKDPAGY